MTDYKAIHGKTVQSLAADPDSAAYEGQIWFNTTSSDYKTITKVAGAWATGGNLNSGRKNPGSAGTQTANLVYGGDQPATDITESYNGSTWTEVADLNTGRRCNPGLGTQTTAIQAGGSPPTVAIVESFDGSSWTEIADLNTARDAGAGSV